MNPMQKKIQQQLNGKLLSDWCEQKADAQTGFYHQYGYDSNGRIVRFMTERTRSLFPLAGDTDGHWKIGSAIVYEIINEPDQITLQCTASPVGLKKREKAQFERLLHACNAQESIKGKHILAQWQLTGETINEAIETLNDVYDIDVMWFEAELLCWQKEPEHLLRSFPCDTRELIQNTELPEEIYIEGAQIQILSNRYERNAKARAKCIALKGTACSVCGFDFGKVYGDEFAGKIEVHHITPVSEIGESYVVDPVRDLVPVCPNCHMMLHSKKDGVFSIAELKAQLIKK